MLEFVNMRIISLIFFWSPLAQSFQVKRQKSGDELENGNVCENGTYVVKQNAMQPVECVSFMYNAGTCCIFFINIKT